MLGLAVAALAAFLISGKIETPQQLYAAAGEASARGDSSAAERLYAQVLDRNLFTAPAWLRLAELERARGNEDRAGLFFQAARTVEPYTLRTEWPLAELELASGDAPAGARRLAGIVSAAPDLLDVALHSAWRSGAEPGQLEQIVPRNDPEAAGRYLAFLTRNRLDVPLPEAYARLGRPGLPQPYRDWLAREAGFRP
jgi:hypothetical protein